MNGLFRPEWSTLKKLMFLQSASGSGYATISGNPVSFTAKAAPLRKLEVAFSPVQNLNGYDSPWPAGGGKNKYDHATMGGVVSPGVTKTTKGFTLAPMASGQNPQICNMNFAWSTDATVIAISFDIWASEDSARISFDGQPDALYTPGTAFADKGIFPTTTKQRISYAGNILNGTTQFRFFRTNSQNKATTATIYIENIQFEFSASATYFAPYSNLCPISGWSSLTVEQRGVNVLDLSSLLTQYGVTFSVDSDGWFTIPNLASPNLYSTHIALPHAITNGSLLLVIDGDNTTDNFRTRVYNGTTAVASTVIGNPQTATLNNITFDSFGFDWSSGGTPHAKFKLLLSLNSTAPDVYVPYNPSSRSISISLGSTVYSGTVDVVTGVGEVTHGIVRADSLEWLTADGGVNGRYFYLSDSVPFVGWDKGGYESFMSNALGKAPLNATSSNAPANSVWWNNASTGWRAIYGNTSTTLAEWNTFITTNNVVFIGQLATPIPIQLTPQEVQSLLGDNVMWSDANGDLTVEYRSN